jgi:hypothetical protein
MTLICWRGILRCLEPKLALDEQDCQAAPKTGPALSVSPDLQFVPWLAEAVESADEKLALSVGSLASTGIHLVVT